MIYEQLSDLHLIQYIPVSTANHSIISIEQYQCKHRHANREGDDQGSKSTLVTLLWKDG
jgi:hypothetical protein